MKPLSFVNGDGPLAAGPALLVEMPGDTIASLFCSPNSQSCLFS